MPTLPTQITVQCPMEERQVDVKVACQTLCKSFKHYAYRGMQMYVVCGFGAEPRREVVVAEGPADPELDEAEEETLEVYEPR